MESQLSDGHYVNAIEASATIPDVSLHLKLIICNDCSCLPLIFEDY